MTSRNIEQGNSLPKARGQQDNLLVHPMGEEIIVYDLARHKARSLNATAATVWRWCDGQTTPAHMAQRLASDSQVSPEDAAALVALALDRLQRARLLEDGAPQAAGVRLKAQPEDVRLKAQPEGQPVVTRRELLRRLKTAGVAVALPVVVTLAAPTAAMAQTGVVPCDCSVCTGVPGSNRAACRRGNTCFCASSPGNCIAQGGTVVQRC